MKRFGIIFLLIVISGLVLYFLLRTNGEKTKNQIFASGTIEITEVEISTKVSGRIEKLSVEEGDSVIIDQVLIELEDRKSVV